MAASSLRTAAAAQALGAPKGIQAPKITGQKPQPSKPPMRFLNKASGKMETRQQMKAYRAPARQMPQTNNAANHPGAQQPAHAGPANPGALSLLEMSPQQIQQRAQGMAQGTLQAELSPLRAQANELRGTEAAAQARFKALGEAQSQNLQNVSNEAQAQAKTAENRAAELALSSGKSIETAGQAQAGQLAGYISPELRAQQLAAGQRAAETGGATQGLAAQSAQNENNYLNNLRAAAAAKVTEGSRQLAAPYAKALAENQNKQTSAVLKLAPESAKINQQLSKEAFNEKATQLGLGIKNSELGLKQGKLGVEQQNASTKARDVGAKTKLGQQKLGLEARKAAFNEWATKEKVAISSLSATDKARYDEAQIRVKEAAAKGKSATPKEGRSYMSKLSTAESIAKSILGTLHQGRGNAASQQKAREELRAKGASSDVISAALNLAVYGRLSTADQAAAISYGLTPQMRPQWFRK